MTDKEITLALIPFPNDFPEKGRYRTWDKNWNPTGFSDEPHHKGQPPIAYPLDASPLEAFLGGYIKSARREGQ
jgi:hypothetical protein